MPNRKDGSVLKSGSFAIVVLLTLALILAAQSSRQVEWLYYGGDPAATRYSTLTDINVSN